MRRWTILDWIDWYFESTALHICLGSAFVFCLVMAGCAATPPKPIVRPQVIEAPKYIRSPIPPEYLQDRVVIEPAPACGELFCNGQLPYIINDCRSVIRASNADKAALRSLQPTEDSH